ncbi:phosphoribosyl-AMP cyclohydrolase [Ancylobacter mangrovi]|uniref:phosphoribosyl-AMP cyclohydrolase n=1 Tax=Ancylobacter mangrovi TaxID=2972472 RepID=UPI002163036E|nr:phosphoribosyl-AMP cyclohydrolase [Ancylobacter mangrovi]MCS0504754.1 phosphoribosyl-AMP cyclohydrolase [Ancylobacter mangrovi]
MNPLVIDLAKAFASRDSVEQIEEGVLLAPRFDADGLIPVVTTDATSGDVLMMGVMNAEALLRTIETREAHYWSRSRKCLWHKGSTSGLVQKIVEIRVDDDQDAVWLRVDVAGEASCHVGYRSCFYRAVATNAHSGAVLLSFKEPQKAFDPTLVYGDTPNPTIL